MFRIEVKTDIERYARRLDDWARRQVPFATARALTLTARDARDEVRKEARRRFILRSKWVERGIRSTSATKRFPVARVGSVDWFMVDQETGGERRALKGRHRAAPLGIRKNVRQRITRAKRPKHLLQKRRFFVNTLKRGPLKGQQALLRRVGKGRFPLQVLYVFERSTKIRAKFGFLKTVERTVERRLSKNFGKSLAAALRTARR